MYYVYLIKSIKFQEQKYVGFTRNLKNRLQEHNCGQSSHTAKYRPWKLIAYLAFQDIDKALEFEVYLKSGSGYSFANKRLW